MCIAGRCILADRNAAEAARCDAAGTCISVVMRDADGCLLACSSSSRASNSSSSSSSSSSRSSNNSSSSNNNNNNNNNNNSSSSSSNNTRGSSSRGSSSNLALTDELEVYSDGRGSDQGLHTSHVLSLDRYKHDHGQSMKACYENATRSESTPQSLIVKCGAWVVRLNLNIVGCSFKRWIVIKRIPNRKRWYTESLYGCIWDRCTWDWNAYEIEMYVMHVRLWAIDINVRLIWNVCVRYSCMWDIDACETEMNAKQRCICETLMHIRQRWR